MAVRTHTFASGRYKIYTDGCLHGYTCWPDRPGEKSVHELFVDNRLRARPRLVTLVHEALHAEFPDMSEEQVTAAGEHIGGFLWRLGYRMRHAKGG